MERRDHRNVWNGGDRAHSGRLIRNDDRRGARDGDDFAARNAFRRALLRRAREHGEEQRRKQCMQKQRDQEAGRQPLAIAAVAGIARELHGTG